MSVAWNLSHLPEIRIGSCPTITDTLIKALLALGLLVQATALGLGFTSVGGRWPIVAAGILVSLGTVFVVFADGGKPDGAQVALLGFSVVVLALAVGHSLSMHPAIVWSLRVGVGLQALGLCLMLAFLIFFKMTRLF